MLQVSDADIEPVQELPRLEELKAEGADIKARAEAGRAQQGRPRAVAPLRPAEGACSAQTASKSPPRLQELLRQTAVLKLNGGLGTSMGLERAKSLLEVGARLGRRSRGSRGTRLAHVGAASSRHGGAGLQCPAPLLGKGGHQMCG